MAIYPGLTSHMSVTPQRKLYRHGVGLGLRTEFSPGVPGPLEYGDDVGEFAKKGIPFSKLSAGEGGLDCGGGETPPAK